ncbi:MAG TPA: twin-arginine translocase TatA/TatE family subunit [Blastocatellia bacterium]|nr:twin-arginine translocase TatA/TatE family subunit [Blastocatellia bacterium]
MGNLGWPEIMIILVLALIVFGPRKLPELGKSLGQGLAQFRKASEDFKRTWEDEVELEKSRIEPPPPDPEPPADDFAIAGSAEDAKPVDPEDSPAVARDEEVHTAVGENEKRDYV